MEYRFRTPLVAAPGAREGVNPPDDGGPDWCLDTQTYRLSRGGEPVSLEPKVFNLLVWLVEHRDRVVLKQELLDSLWPGEHVGDAVLPRCVAAVRKVLGDSRALQAVIQTVHGRGYRFVAETKEVQVPGGAATDRDSTLQTSQAATPASNLANASQFVQEVPEPFVGRDRVIDSLRSTLEDAIAGSGRLVVLVGEPGIGKTRTADEVASEAGERGVEVLVGQCIEGEGAPAFWPWLQILRALGADHAHDRIVAELGGSSTRDAGPGPSAVESPAMAGEDTRFQLFYRTCEALREASSTTPLMIVLDDLHWADPSSLLLLRFAARELSGAHILLLCTYRDVALRRGHPLASLLAELARLPHFQRLLLRGLERRDVESYIEQSSGHEPPTGLAEAIFEHTEGNPFFVGEIVRWLESRGELVPGDSLSSVSEAQGREAGSGTSAVSWKLSLPQGAREAVGRRLDELSDPCNRVLQVASVQGRIFSLSTTEIVLQMDRGELLEVLEEALSARVLRADPESPGRYSFAHAIVEQTVYEELTLPMRVHLHEQTGEALSLLHQGDLDEVAEELAHHFFQAATGGNTQRAIECLHRAARRATQLLAFEQAVLHYQRALQVLALSTDADAGERALLRCELMLSLGDEQSRSGDRTTARDTFEIAAEQARTLERNDLFARAALGVGGRSELGAGNDPLLTTLLEESLSRLPETELILRSRILSRMTGADPYTFSMSERERLSSEAWSLAVESGDLDTQVHALGARLWAYLGPDHVEERMALGNQALEISRQMRTSSEGFLSSDPAFLGHEARLGAMLLLGDIAGADREIDAAEARAITLGEPINLWFAHWWRASRAVSDGRYADAERMIAEGQAFSIHARHPLSALVYRGLDLWMAVNRGDWRKLHDGMEIITDNPLSLGAIVPALMANLARFEGRMDDGREHWDEISAKEFKDIQRGDMWLFTMGMLCDLCTDFGNREQAAQLFALIEPYAELNSVMDLLRTQDGAVAGYLAHLCVIMDRNDEAEHYFEAAQAMNERSGARPALASTLYYEARWRLRSGSDPDRGFVLLDRAEALAVELDLGHRLRDMRTLREEFAASGR